MSATRRQTGLAWSPADLRSNPHDTADKAQRVERMFAAIARSYDLNNRVHSFGRDQAWRRSAVRLAEVGPDDDVLDVACGTGDLSFAFSAAGPASVTGVDFTPQMIEVARAKAARRRLSTRARQALKCPLRFEVGDAMRLRFDNASFEVVSIAFGIRNVADPAVAIGEFHRVLRPGGRLVVLEFSQPRNRVLRAINGLYCGRIMPLTATLLARDRSGAYRYLPRSIETFYTADELDALMAAAGLELTESRPMTMGVCTAHVARKH